jgi:hypothetical protein
MISMSLQVRLDFIVMFISPVLKKKGDMLVYGNRKIIKPLVLVKMLHDLSTAYLTYLYKQTKLIVTM